MELFLEYPDATMLDSAQNLAYFTSLSWVMILSTALASKLGGGRRISFSISFRHGKN
jgi:hypothetical protein